MNRRPRPRRPGRIHPRDTRVPPGGRRRAATRTGDGVTLGRVTSLRIAVVTETFYPALDGTTTTLKAQIDRWVDLGHTVRVITATPGIASYRTATVVRLRPLEPVGGQVRAALDAFRPDLVQVVSPGTVGRKALKHTRRVGVPAVVLATSPVLDVAADYWRSRVADRADLVVVTAQWMLGRMGEFGVGAHHWEPGVDPVAFTPALRDQWLHESWGRAHGSPGSPHGRGPRLVVGYVGGLEKRHGVRRLAELGRVPGVRPVIIGAGSQRDWLESRLPGARFTGPLSTGDLTIALPSLDVLVHPGEHETCAHALREAGASGVPVIAPRAGGARDVVVPLETGLLYEPGATRGLADAVASIAADPRRRLLGEAARERALRRTWVQAVDEVTARYRSLVGATAAA